MMESYLKLAPKYLSAHKKKTRLTTISVVMAVTLVVAMFSMLDSMVTFEKKQVLKDEGNYHIYVRNPTEKEINHIQNRIEVKNSGRLKDLGEGKLNSQNCGLGALDESFSKNLNFIISKGKYPTEENEIMLEKWIMEKQKLNLGEKTAVSFPDGTSQEYIISGIFNDWGETKAANVPFVILSMRGAQKHTFVTHDYFVLFKDGVNIISAENAIKKALDIPDKRIRKNERLLALMLQTKNNQVQQIYLLGCFMFLLVLITAVVMIYNTFNISVMDRIRYFGLLRCIGASRTQVKRIVRREGISIAVRAIPIGTIIGIVLTSLCLMVLKYYNSSLFGNIPVISLSIVGIVMGVLVGFLTVLIASIIPAKKASRVSAVNALTGGSEIKLSKRKKYGFMTRVISIEIAMGISNAVKKKKTLILMSCSIAFSILVFLSFNVLINPKNLGMQEIKEFTRDISLVSHKGIPENIINKLSEAEGVKRSYGRSTDFVKAVFKVDLLTDSYKKEKGNIKPDKDGEILEPEASLLLSHDKSQLDWLKKYLKSGQCDEKDLNASNGLVFVEKSQRKKSMMLTARFKPGDEVKINTVSGIKSFKVLGVINSSLFNSYMHDNPVMATFITTEALFNEISGKKDYTVLDIQVDGDKEAVDRIKSITAGTDISLHDLRQLNQKAKNSFMTAAVFLYGFIGVIALISILNIINTMNTSITARTRYLGVMRAIGMSGGQLTRMVITEAEIYSIAGCIAGCTFGILLQRAMVNIIISEWKFPVIQVCLIFVVCIVMAGLSVIAPIKRIKRNNITESIGFLQ